MDSNEAQNYRPPLPLLFQLFSPNNYSLSSAALPLIAMVEDSSVHAESVELRSRNTKVHGTVGGTVEAFRHEHFTSGGANGGRIPLIEHVVKSGESLMQISLHYSVPVSEIKRVNNIVADHEIHGLPLLKVPMTRAFLLRRQMIETEEEKGNEPTEGKIIELFGEEGTSSVNCDSFEALADDGEDDRMPKDFRSHWSQTNRHQYALRKSDFGSSLNGRKNIAFRSSDESLAAHAKEAIEGILDETDRNMATVRQNLPSPSLEGGAFHFVDAGVPDNSSNVWLVVAVVLIIFVLLPLALTFLEESGEMEEHRQQRPHS